MLGENKNLRDTSKDSVKDSEWKSLTSYKAGTFNIDVILPYTKINKLITALYMVTDTMDREEPLRLKLRTLGVEVLSDTLTMSKTPFDIQKLDQILSFLNIALDVGMISEMNCNILKKEFVELKKLISEFKTQNNAWLEGFITHTPEIDSPMGQLKSEGQSGLSFNKGHGLPAQAGTRIGVQKGSTLMKALSKIGDTPALRNFSEDREILKQKRRESILKIIKDKPNGVSIKDIISALRELGEEKGAKTLQRELVSMVKDNVLNKIGEKRWSKYFANTPKP